MKDDPKLTLETLEDKYNLLSNSSTDKAFLINLIRFLDYFFSNDLIVDNVCNVIQAQKENDEKPFNDISEKRLENIKATFEKVKGYIEHKESQDDGPNIDNDLKEFTGYLEGRIQSSNPLVESLAHAFWWLMNRYVKDFKFIDDYFKSYAELNDKEEFKLWTYDTYLLDYENEKRIYERKKAISLWLPQDTLYDFYNIYNNYEKIHLELVDQDKIMGSMGLDLYYREIDDVLNEKPLKDVILFKKESLFDDVKSLFFYTKEALAKIDLSSTSNALPLVKLCVASPFYGLLVNNKKVKFQENSFQYDLLKLVLKNQMNKKKTWQYSELCETLGYNEFTKKQLNDKCYKACWNICEKVKQQANLEDFLIFNKLTVKVNSLITLC